MTDNVVLVTEATAFAELTRIHLAVQGLTVDIRRKLPQRAPRVHFTLVDAALVDESSARSFALRARMNGTEVALCGHWARAEEHRELARRVRLNFIEYPVDPRSLRSHFAVNPIRVRAHPYERLRHFTRLAGLLFAKEGVASFGLDRLAQATSLRMAALGENELKQYLARVQSERLELCSLGRLLGRTDPSLFQPYSVYEALRTQVLPRLQRGAEALVLASDDGTSAAALAALAGAVGLARFSVHDPQPKSSDIPQFPLSRFDETPFEFRDLARSILQSLDSGMFQFEAGVHGAIKNAPGLEPLLNNEPRWDLIHMRGQLFTEERRRELIQRALQALRPGGLLAIEGDAELPDLDYPAELEGCAPLRVVRQPIPEASR